MSASIQSVDKHDFYDGEKLLGKAEGLCLIEAHRLINPGVAEAIKALRIFVKTISVEVYKVGQEDAKDVRERYNQIREIVK